MSSDCGAPTNASTTAAATPTVTNHPVETRPLSSRLVTAQTVAEVAMTRRCRHDTHQITGTSNPPPRISSGSPTDCAAPGTQRRQLVPRDATALSAWLREPTLTSRNLQTITALRAAARAAHRKAVTRSVLRVLLWITTVLAGITELSVIGATASGVYRNQPVGVAIGVNIFIGLIFVVLLFFALSGPQRIRKRRNK